MSGANRHVKGNIRNWKGMQLDYDNTIVGASVDYGLYCLSSTQAEALRALVVVQAWETRWFSPTNADIDTDKIDEFTSEVITRLMDDCCCGGASSNQYRWTDDGHYQVSTDGGETWVDAPIEDPRYSVPLFPPNTPVGALNDLCTYADSVVFIFQKQFVEAIQVGDTAQQIIGIIIGILSAVLGTVAAPLVYQIMAVVVGAILAFTIEAFQEAFTEEVWDRLRCNLVANMSEDGSFTQDQVDSVYEQVGEDETGIVDFVLKHAIATFGAKGLSNAARSGFGSIEADCDACNEFCGDTWVWADPPFPPNATVVYDAGEHTITADAVFNPSNSFYYIAFNGLDNCCYAEADIVSTGDILFEAGWSCETEDTPDWGNEENPLWISPDAGNWGGFIARSATTFSITLRFT